ncbi:nitrite reductase [Paenibacillus antri]|uniref:Nitrite reductase n=1 Tax=Paenibacillus antri TaxID=2582848 RepID=A0A5R9GF11_9BACL|nr:nitrite reductase [Paenibacillus antri]TLS49985.1 nitrite reductase [Paenibacillus antri]
MAETMKIAVAPPIQVGGSLFSPQQLAKIGSIADTEVKIEMTPFKQLYVEVPSDRYDTVKEELVRTGLEVYPAGFVVKSLIACNFCKGAEEAGLETARKLNQAFSGIETPTPLKIGYAGCALGTSEPLLKDISVVKIRDTYDVYVGGEPKGLKTIIAQKFASDLSEDQLVPLISKIIHYYKGNAKGKEKFSKFLTRVSLDQLQNACELGRTT